MDFRFFVFSSVLWLACSVSAQEKNTNSPDSEVLRLPIDPGRVEFDTEVHFSFINETTGWAIWKSYFQGHEKVCARSIRLKQNGNHQVGAVVEISDTTKGIFGLNLYNEAATWSRIQENGEWRIERFDFSVDAVPGSPRNSPMGKGMRPQIGVDAIAWQELVRPSESVIHWQTLTDHQTYKGKESGGLRFHPAVCEVGDGKGAICFWDEYKDGTQWIAARKIYPDKGIVEKISPDEPGVRCLNPVPLHTVDSGLCVAWIKLRDAIGGEGVIDMIHTAHVAIRKPDGTWNMVTDENGDDEGAVMLNGLLPDLRPGKGYPSGYAGNRRKPMLLDAGEEGVWLLWERKTKHSGGGTKTAGQLIGRRFQNGKWTGGPQLIHHGLIDYRLAPPEQVRENGHTFFVIGSNIPRGWKRPSYLVEIDLKKAVPINLDDWRDQFKPVKLPYSEPNRYRAESNGKKYQLYWGDLHCHSGLTGDAEGEPDEIVLYGRDRAKLDVMVLQDNDEVHGRILTEGEYRIGASHSQWITEPGKFVALPGYEWTQRTTLKGVPFPYQPVYEQSLKRRFPQSSNSYLPDGWWSNCTLLRSRSSVRSDG